MTPSFADLSTRDVINCHVIRIPKNRIVLFDYSKLRISKNSISKRNFNSFDVVRYHFFNSILTNVFSYPQYNL